MIALVLGVAALVVAIAFLRWFAGANPKTLLKGMRYFGAGALALAAVGLAALDRVGLASLAASMAWALFTNGHLWPGGWPYPHRSSPTAASGTTTSQVKTEWLEIELSLADGKMTGRVLKGDYAGDLDVLSNVDLAKLHRFLEGVDAESAQLLEAYLDRRFGPDWRASPEFVAVPSSAMSRAEAYAVLGLSSDASADDVRAAHRRLITQIHPDHGGSSYLAAKINEARDLLLG
jgi:hypothetical protein